MSSDDIDELLRDQMSDNDWLNVSDDGDELSNASNISLSGDSFLSDETIIPREEQSRVDDEQTWTFVTPERNEHERDRRATSPLTFLGEPAGIKADVPYFVQPVDSFQWFIDDTLL